MDNKQINEKYEKVSKVLEDALNESMLVKVKGEEENVLVSKIKDELNKINIEFSNDINELEKSSVWDKLRVTYFGETNSGKSTIIDAMRIVFDENSRKKQIEANVKNYQNNFEVYSNRIKQLCEEINNLKNIKNIYIINKKLLFAILFTCIIFGLLIGYIIFRII